MSLECMIPLILSTRNFASLSVHIVQVISPYADLKDEKKTGHTNFFKIFFLNINRAQEFYHLSSLQRFRHRTSQVGN